MNLPFGIIKGYNHNYYIFLFLESVAAIEKNQDSVNKSSYSHVFLSRCSYIFCNNSGKLLLSMLS